MIQDIFAEWDGYALEQQKRPRRKDIKKILASAKKKPLILTGIRRSGKSSFLMLLRQELEVSGIIAYYINLEDARLKGNPDLLDDILKWSGDEGYLLLDEITSVDEYVNYQNWIYRIHETLQGRLALILSSSVRSLLLPAKELRGRMRIEHFYPLSFKEYLDFIELEIKLNTSGIGKIEQALEEYLLFGGFPEIVLESDPTEKIITINSYFREILALDVTSLSPTSFELTELFGKYVIETDLFSASKCLNFLKTLGYKIAKSSILHLEAITQEACLFFFSQIYSTNIKDRNQYPRKAYMGDTGFLKGISGKIDWGKLYENTVYLELLRRILPNQNLNYWKNDKGIEVDIIIREGFTVINLYQVAYNLTNKETLKREKRGLVKAAHDFRLKEGFIISKEVEDQIEEDGILINIVPLWRWLIS